MAHVLGPQFVAFAVDALGRAETMTLFGAAFERVTALNNAVIPRFVA